jgi:hypothetical protein
VGRWYSIGIKESIKLIPFTADTPLPAGPLLTGRQAVPTEGGAGREIAERKRLLLIEYLILGQPDPRWFFLS